FGTLHVLCNVERLEPWSVIRRAAIYVRWKTYDQAVAALGRARSKAPAIAEGAVLQGDLARLQGDPAGAEKAYREALGFRPNDTFAFDGLGLLALARGKSAEAA